MQTARETATAEREKTLALIRAAEQSEVDDTRVRSEAGTLVSMAEAQARATLERANAEKDELLARAQGTAALIAAENAQSPDLIGLKLDQARIKALPGIVEKMMKPAEKIESIRINHITGIGPGASEWGGGAGGDGSAMNQVVDGMLKLALQLPAVKKLGEEVGLNIGGGVRGLSASLEGKHGGDRGGGEPPGDEK